MSLHVMCSRQGCKAQATHHLNFMAWGQSIRKVKATAIIGQLPLPLCFHHASLAAAEEGLFSPATWDMVVKEVHRRGQDTPLLEDVQIVPVQGLPIKQPEEPVQEASS